MLRGIHPDKVMLTGGGALLLQDDILAINRYFLIHPNPRFANVIGFYRAAKTMPDQTGAGGSNAEHRDHTRCGSISIRKMTAGYLNCCKSVLCPGNGMNSSKRRFLNA